MVRMDYKFVTGLDLVGDRHETGLIQQPTRVARRRTAGIAKTSKQTRVCELVPLACGICATTQKEPKTRTRGLHLTPSPEQGLLFFVYGLTLCGVFDHITHIVYLVS